MRIRTTAAAMVLAAGAALPLAGVAQAQPDDRDCPDFSSQQEAQEALDSAVGDPERLDADDDGIACETLDGSDSGGGQDDAADDQVTAVPRGGVDTGDGSAAGDEAPVLLLLGGFTAAAGATVVVTRRAARRSD